MLMLLGDGVVEVENERAVCCGSVRELRPGDFGATIAGGRAAASLPGDD